MPTVKKSEQGVRANPEGRSVFSCYSSSFFGPLVGSTSALAKIKMRSVRYGPVYVLAGPHVGRIAFYDNDDEERAVCYFGSLLMHDNYEYIDYSHIRPVTTGDLIRRKEEIMKDVFPFQEHSLDDDQKLDLLYEFVLVDQVLMERIESAKLSARGDERTQIFISHSSNDAHLAWLLSVDLGNFGFRPWLDEWEILVGDSIPASINSGLGACEALIVLLSPASVESGWVEREWQAKYWDEAQEKDVKVLPILVEACQIPYLLRPKKYADFRTSYDQGLAAILKALQQIKNG